MQILAEKLMGKKTDNTLQAVSAVFGSLGNLSRILESDGPRLRVGLWPIQSDTKPMVAMGIVTVLGFLLEARRDITVYRLVARLDGEPENYEWSIKDSQFDVDDWGLDDLDENVAIWGNLTSDNEQWTLELEVENDLAAEPDDLKQFTFEAKSLPDLIAKLPQAAAEIAEFLDADEPDPTRPAYQIQDWNSPWLERMLEKSFNWELQLLLTLWGKAWPEDQAKEDYLRLSAACKELGGELGAWMAANQLKRALLPMFAPLDEGLFPLVGEVVEIFDRSVFPSLLLHDAIYRLDDPQNSYELLESLTEDFRSSEAFWLALGRLYLRGQHLHESVDAYQRGIEAEAASKSLYAEYARLLRQIILSEIPFGIGETRESITGRAFTEDVILTESDSDDVADVLGWEVIEAYHAVLKESADDTGELLFSTVIQLAELEAYDEMWDDFGRLVAVDDEGDYVGLALDTIEVPDMTNAVNILNAAVKHQDTRCDLRINLGAALLRTEEYDRAQTVLEKARGLTNDADVLTEIDRLLLMAEDPDFEARMGELAVLVDAGVSVSADSAEFLEDVIERVPRLAEAYVLLAKAYIKWGEKQDALDVLLDGQKRLPEHPDILEPLAQLLWDSHEHDLAMNYLNKGLTANPKHVPLLVLAGRCLFDDEQFEAAKRFLMRAESLEPRSLLLAEARAYIAKSMLE